MKPFFLNLIILLILSSAVANAQNEKVAIPDSWKKIEACGITFYAPSDLMEDDYHGKDSCVRIYRSNDFILSLDVFGFGGGESSSRKDEYSDEKDFLFVKTKISGRKAEIITYYETEYLKQWKDLRYNSVLFVPVIDKDGTSLTMWTNSRTAKDREISKKIFATVHF